MDTNQRREAWRTFAQTFEIGYWTLRGEDLGKPEKCSKAPAIWQRFGFTQDQFAGKTIVDLGCGPTGMGWWFLGAKLIGVDPLADHYRKLPWVDVGIYTSLVAAPLEQPRPELAGVADFAICMNCLDHCYDLDLACKGIAHHLKPGGKGWVSVDCDKGVANDPTHPICVGPARITAALGVAGLRIDKTDHGTCYPNNDGTWRNNWGGGVAYHYWVSKP